jgi:hypothetical protein
LEAGRPGTYGKATARLSVHALKVAMIFAALDGVNAIGLRHLQAALSLIAVADRTALELFGTPSAVANGEAPAQAKLLTYARTRQDGITKTDAHRLFSNKKDGNEISAVFAQLTPAFGQWKNERWFAKMPESDMGVGGANETPLTVSASQSAAVRWRSGEQTDGEAANAVERGSL